MKIGIIYFSKTGHTKLVVEKLAARLVENKHDIQMSSLEISAPWSSSSEFLPLKYLPEVRPYDFLVIGTPVHGGRLSSPMRTFLESTQNFHRKKIAILITHLFWKGWGTNQTIQQIKEISAAKGADLIGFGDVMWPGFGRNKRIDIAVDQIISYIPD